MLLVRSRRRRRMRQRPTSLWKMSQLQTRLWNMRHLQRRRKSSLLERRSRRSRRIQLQTRLWKVSQLQRRRMQDLTSSCSGPRHGSMQQKMLGQHPELLKRKVLMMFSTSTLAMGAPASRCSGRRHGSVSVQRTVTSQLVLLPATASHCSQSPADSRGKPVWGWIMWGRSSAFCIAHIQLICNGFTLRTLASEAMASRLGGRAFPSTTHASSPRCVHVPHVQVLHFQ
mmetsp:Transcript_138482/g.240866  ORF Transcript_138482/g.240866 Transcript_138482/m.240866 type:complete len:227 (-) Transcript_138482:284-964(-)